MTKTEDEVRELAKQLLGFESLNNKNIKFGVGQLTTFNSLDNKFAGMSDKPDGWYLPQNSNDVAVILEFKSSDKDLNNKNIINELLKNIKIAQKKYKKVVGILYNSETAIVYKNLDRYSEDNTLKNINFYIHLFDENNIDTQLIYNVTKRINDSLHIDFGIKNLYHRMIFTACALVADKYGAVLSKGMNYITFHSSICSTLEKSLSADKKQNQKLELLLDVYKEIKMNQTENQNAIDKFIENISIISKNLDSQYWNGEDVMGIFFNEFNRYKKKSESGQVFTPDHITSFMYRLIGCTKNDIILDATCGSGAFLVKAMSNMINEIGGEFNKESELIKTTHLYGIEFDREIFALACANMLIHKDGKTNLEQLDTRTEEACEWIKDKNITKVLMNPPYEKRYGCMKIVENVLNSVPNGILCAFILPDKKLEVNNGKKLLKKHTLITIIKLPENLFNAGVVTSIYVFKTGEPQNNRQIVGYYIEDDGLETVKNKGRQDIKNKWHNIENYWINAIQIGNDDKFNTKQIINPQEHLSYQILEKSIETSEEDFIKTLMDYEMFKQRIDVREFQEKLIYTIMYSGNIAKSDNLFTIDLNNDKINISKWKEFKIGDLFTIETSKKRFNAIDINITDDYSLHPYVARSSLNNGIKGYIDEDKEYLNNGNTLSFGQDTATCFYQERPYFTGDKIKVLYPIGFELNQHIALFIISSMNKTLKHMTWGQDSFNVNLLKDIKINLPVKDNQPDFDYMTQLIKSLEKKVSNKLKIFSQII